MQLDSVLEWGRWAAAVIGGLLIGFLGGWDVALQVLVYFVVADYVTGVIAAFYEKKLDSEVGMWGIFRKILLFIPVAIGFWLDTLAGVEVFRSMAIFFYLANEGLSILENLGRMGIPFPDALRAALEQLKKTEESKDGLQRPQS